MESLPPTILVIFGITGDLSHRYLLPALAQICHSGKLSKDFKILGVSRRDIGLDDILGPEQESLRAHSQTFQMDPDRTEDYHRLKLELEKMSTDLLQKPQIIFYLVVPPDAVLPIIANLGRVGLNTPNTKLLLEKPFGTDLESATELIEETAKHFKPRQVYRIDHYLAKEVAQNIAVFLGSNTLFRHVWSNKFIERIDILASEDIGLQSRVDFWETTGTLRDFVQSHLLQLAALSLMEPCSHLFDFAELPQRRLAALKHMSLKNVDQAIRGQYRGYRREAKNPKSRIETFVSLIIQSSDPRWRGVPIRLTTGKKLDKKLTQIQIFFKQTQSAEANELTLRLHPSEGIEIDLWVKKPGYDHELQKQPLKFLYERRFGRVPDAYEQVLIDAMRSKQSLFASNEEVLASWKILQPLLDGWSKNDNGLEIYKPGASAQQVLKSHRV